MYERFTQRARKVMQLANQEAQQLNHEYIGTEHILLGLVKEGGVGCYLIESFGIDRRKVRLDVEKIIKRGPDCVTMGKLLHTPRARAVIEYAIEEADNLGHNDVGLEHVLLGLLREREGVAAEVLKSLGLVLDSVRVLVVVARIKCKHKSGDQESKEIDDELPKGDESCQMVGSCLVVGACEVFVKTPKILSKSGYDDLESMLNLVLRAAACSVANTDECDS